MLGLFNENVFSLDVLNSRKKLFPYGRLSVNNTSQDLTLERIKTFNLRMTASEVSTFVNLLPLMIGDLVPQNNKHWLFLIQLLELSEALFVNSIDRTLKMI